MPKNNFLSAEENSNDILPLRILAEFPKNSYHKKGRWLRPLIYLESRFITSFRIFLNSALMSPTISSIPSLAASWKCSDTYILPTAAEKLSVAEETHDFHLEIEKKKSHKDYVKMMRRSINLISFVWIFLLILKNNFYFEENKMWTLMTILIWKNSNDTSEIICLVKPRPSSGLLA